MGNLYLAFQQDRNAEARLPLRHRVRLSMAPTNATPTNLGY